MAHSLWGPPPKLSRRAGRTTFARWHTAMPARSAATARSAAEPLVNETGRTTPAHVLASRANRAYSGALFVPRLHSRPLFSLLVLLLPLPVDIKFLLLAPEIRRAFPLDLIPV